MSRITPHLSGAFSLLWRALLWPVPARTVRRWLQPSLARRVLLVALGTFALVWVVLVARDVQLLRDDPRHLEAMQRSVRAMAGVLDHRPESEARLIVETTERQFNELRHQGDPPPGLGDVLFQLERLPGPTLVYRSTGWKHPVDALTDGRPAMRTLAGQAHWAAAQDTTPGPPQWRITLLAPTLTDPRVPRWLAGHLVEPLLISFPLVFIPLWLAVRQGLRPLRDLVDRVRARAPDDFSPLNLRLPQAELQPLEQALEHLLTRAREGIARERAMVQDAAHELRTPLAVMTAQAHALVQAPDDRTRQEARTALEGAVQRASHLVHQLMTLARLEGSASNRPQTVDLVAETRQILIATHTLADRRRIEIELDSPERLTATLDTMAFHSVLDNLLRNALAYGHEGGRVLVTLQALPDALRLSVVDNGPGIPEADRARVFDRFHRGGKALDTQGAGLGLAIVQQAARRMGGQVDLGEGLNGQGVGFHLLWPQFHTPIEKT